MKRKLFGILGAGALLAGGMQACGGSSAGALLVSRTAEAFFDAAGIVAAVEALCDDNDVAAVAGVAKVDTVTVDTAANSTDYTITVDGEDYTITSDGSATTTEIAAALAACMNTGTVVGGCKVATTALSGITAAAAAANVTLTADAAGTWFLTEEADANLDPLVNTTANVTPSAALKGCDGDLFDFITFEVVVDEPGAATDTVDIDIDDLSLADADETHTYTVVADDTPDDVETGLIAQVNVTTPSLLATASAGSVLVIADDIDADFTVDAIPTDNAGATFPPDGRTTDITSNDFEAFLALIDMTETPEEDDLVTCYTGTTPAAWGGDADCTGNIGTLPGAGDFKRVALRATDTVNCNGTDTTDGTIFASTTVTGTIDSAGAFDTDEGPLHITGFQDFRNCTLTGDLGVEGGGVTTTITLDGRIDDVAHAETVLGDCADADDCYQEAEGTIDVETDLDGAGADFWLDTIDVLIAGSDDGVTEAIDGGACFGGLVDLGGAGANDDEIDTDDDCAAGADPGIFVTATDLD